jgi:transcriptional regulator
MVAKSTLGYSSRTEAVLALRSQGLETKQIAQRIGIPPGTVTALEASALRSAARKERPASEQGRAMLVPLDVLNSMRRAAFKRGLTPNELAGLIVSTVVDNKLIDAVLDDEVTG